MFTWVITLCRMVGGENCKRSERGCGRCCYMLIVDVRQSEEFDQPFKENLEEVHNYSLGT